MLKVLVLIVMSILISVVNLFANPTGAPLSYYAVEPCRFFDTRASSPIPNNTAIDVFVRGSNLQPSTGALRTDCHIPITAQAVVVAFTVIAPTSSGYLKINGTGSVAGPEGPYARFIYRFGENDSNEMTISLCNTTVHPFPHQACPFDGINRYLDFQVLNLGVTGSTIHVAGDVIGYYAFAEVSEE